MSYTIDVYRKKLKPTNDIIAFASFVSFFPQLVAGPIERATNLLPQFHQKRHFNYPLAVDGMRQILWGLFKKMVIADNCAIFVNEIFENYGEYSGSTLFLGAFFFAFQIYGDFSGYSDIAIGTARLFGFDLMRNFAYPYFSRDIAEFWRRWHISLSTWFRDYLYIPLGGSKGGRWQKIRNTFIIFIVSGFWHGANWTFIVWGLINALYFTPLLLLNANRRFMDIPAAHKHLPSVRELFQIGFTFFIVVVAWVFFRAENLFDALSYINKMFFSSSLFSMPYLFNKMILSITFIVILTSIEWMQRAKEHGLQLDLERIPTIVRWGLYYFLIFSIITHAGSTQEFIYFQF